MEKNCQLKIQKLKDKLKKLNEDILFNQEILNSKRQQIRTAKINNAKNENAFEQVLHIKDVQNKHVKKKYNEALSYNEDVRRQIDKIRLEKKLFNRILENLEEELTFH